MEIIKRLESLSEFINSQKTSGSPISFVPTMGALHKGHISLIEKAKEEGGIIICSIFVNPTQFTDPKDLDKYPRPLEHDIQMLESAGCHAVFMPLVTEMYPSWPEPEVWNIDLGPAEFVLEGEFRKGHYQGVTQIVKKLFDAVQPQLAYFGQKDFQQVLMIEKMVNLFGLDVKVISCPIVREHDGLAMSSRNIHLSAVDRQNSIVLFKALTFIKENYSQRPISEILEQAREMIQSVGNVELEYLTIAHRENLEAVDPEYAGKAVALVAAKVGATRLIDNVLLP